MQFSSFSPIDRTLSGAITSGQSGPGSDGNERILRISQSSSTTGTSPSDCLVSYLAHSLEGGAYPFAGMQSVYSTAPANRENFESVSFFCVILARCDRELSGNKIRTKLEHMQKKKKKKEKCSFNSRLVQIL